MEETKACQPSNLREVSVVEPKRDFIVPKTASSVLFEC